MEANAATFEPDELLRHARWMRALARELVGDEHAAEDLVQETWVAALEHEPDTSRPLRPWLARVLRDFFQQRLRGEGRRRAREERASRSECDLTADELLGRAEAHALVVAEVQKLHEPFRETVLLRYFEGRSAVEIAKLRGLPDGTVRWRLKRGLDELRERLDQRFEGERSAWCLLLAPLVAPAAPVPPVSASPLAAAPRVVSTASSVTRGVLAMSLAAKCAAVLVPLAVVAFGIGYWEELAPQLTSPDEQLTIASYRPLTEAPADPTSLLEPDLREARTPVPASAPVVDSDAEAVDSMVATIRARFLDQHGQPVAFVEFRAAGSKTESATSTLGGEVELTVTPRASRRTEFIASRHGFVTERLTATISPGSSVHLGDLALAPGGELSGRVLDPEGHPIEGAVVARFDEDIKSWEWERVHRWAYPRLFAFDSPTVRTDSTGSFSLRGLPVGAARVGATADGFAAALSSPLEVVWREEGFGLELRLEPLSREQCIAGSALSASGAPVPHARLEWQSAISSGPRWADAAGRFAFRVPPDVEVSLTAIPLDEATTAVSAERLRGGDSDVELRFAANSQVELRVRSRAGKPIERFAVRVRSAGEQLVLHEVEQSAHADGHTRVSAPGQSFVIEVVAPGFALATLGPFEGAATVECVLDPSPELSGLVRANGQPVSGVELQLAEDVGTAMSTDGFPSRYRLVQPGESSVSDANGEFALTVREAGIYYVLAESGAHAAAELGPLELSAGQSRASLEFDLVRGGALEGTVVSTTGQQVAGVIVGISRGGIHPRSQRVGPDGRFRFERLTPGPWQVERIESELGFGSSSRFGGPPPAELPWNCTIFDGEVTTFELVLEGDPDAPEPVRVDAVLSIDGEPAGGWTAMLLSGPDWRSRENSARTDARGDVQLVASVAGRCKLTLLGEHLFVSEFVELSPGSNSFAFELETGSISGTVQGVESNGDNPALFFVVEGPGERMWVAPIVPEPDGSFHCGQVPAGAGRILWMEPGASDLAEALPLRELVVRKGELTTLDLRGR